jgi:2-polyprenyl-6-methoxyphenol hydroxylase-like FAD-dependent oxidoreductase
MSQPLQFDAIIIGAGPAGASAAILLARHGWRIAVVEKQIFPRRKVCGECIAASNLPLLHALGIGAALSEFAGPPLREIAVMHRDQTIRAAFPPYAHAPQKWGVALGRDYLDALLLEQAAACGADLFQPWAARAIEGAPGRFRCHIARMHSAAKAVLTAPVLIDAHGSWEAIDARHGANQLPQRASDLFAFKASFTQGAMEAGVLPVLSFPGGYGGMVLAGRSTTTLAFCMRRDMLARCRKAMPQAKTTEAALAYVTSECAGVRAMLAGARQQGAWLGVGPIRPGIRLRPHGRQAFLIGNAAGEAHPVIGEGLSMAIQSAWLLAHKLAPHRRQIADGRLQQTLLREYAHAWRRQFTPRIRVAAAFAHLAMHPAARCALPVLQAWPQLLTHAARWSGKVRCIPHAPADNGLPPPNNADNGASDDDIDDLRTPAADTGRRL